MLMSSAVRRSGARGGTVTEPRAFMILDTETRSPRDLRKCGPYRYSEPPEPGGEDRFELLLLDWRWKTPDGTTSHAWAPFEEPMPDGLVEALTDPTVVKVAHNAGFDRVILSRLVYPDTVGEFLDPSQWYDTRAAAAEVALPGGLDKLARALGFKGKLDEGKALIRFFDNRVHRDDLVEALGAGRDALEKQREGCYSNGRLIRGCKPERDRLDVLLSTLEKWARYKLYCHQDVTCLSEIFDALPHMDAEEWALWQANERVNDRGVRIDRGLVHAAAARRDVLVAEGYRRLQHLTGLDNPNSGLKMSRWLWERGYRTAASPETLDGWGGRTNLVGLNSKDDVPGLRKQALARGDDLVLAVLEARDDVAARATKKFDALQLRVSADGRARGCFQFYGAGHTGRFTSKGLQLQNLPRISGGEFDLIAFACDNPSVLAGLTGSQIKQTLRGVLQADEVFSVADFSAVEARVTAWLAGQDDELDAFRAGRDIYLATWAAMTGTACEDYTHESPERPLGKACTLGCGFGGGVAGINRVGGDRIRPTEDFARQWRQGQWEEFHAAWSYVYRHRDLPPHPKDVHRALLPLVGTVPYDSAGAVFESWAGAPAQKNALHDAYIDHLKNLWRKAHPMIVCFWRDLEDAFRSAAFQGLESRVGAHVTVAGDGHGTVQVVLPSGRRLWYRGVHVERRNPAGGRPARELTYRDSLGMPVHTHGGKLTENVVQATARDLLRTAFLTLDRGGEKIVAHIHDEIVCEGRPDLRAAMVAQPSWAAGLPLDADTAESTRYLGH